MELEKEEERWLEMHKKKGARRGDKKGEEDEESGIR